MIEISTPTVPEAVNKTADAAVRHPYVAAAVVVGVGTLAVVKYVEMNTPGIRPAIDGWAMIGRGLKKAVHDMTSSAPVAPTSTVVRAAE